MLSYTSRRALFGSLINSTASATLTVGDTLMNNIEKMILSKRDWRFLRRQYTKNTVANESVIRLPAYLTDPESVYVTVGAYRYTPERVATRAEWDTIKLTSVTGDTPTHYFVYDGAIELFPTPVTSSNVVSFNARRKPRDLSVADYTTGTITTVATSGVTTTVTGSSVTWTTGMIGKHIRITDGNAANLGDGIWYEIATVPTSTTLTLVRTYGGTAITAGSASYTIADCSLLPEPYDMLPVYGALRTHFTSIDPNTNKAKLYEQLYTDGYADLVASEGSYASVVVDDGVDTIMENPNNYITL